MHFSQRTAGEEQAYTVDGGEEMVLDRLRSQSETLLLETKVC